MGTIELNFANKPDALEIFAMEDNHIPLYSKKVIEKTVTVPLCFGYYSVYPFSLESNGLYNKMGFQINTNRKNVKIFYDENNRGYFHKKNETN